MTGEARVDHIKLCHNPGQALVQRGEKQLEQQAEGMSSLKIEWI